MNTQFPFVIKIPINNKKEAEIFKNILDICIKRSTKNNYYPSYLDKIQKEYCSTHSGENEIAGHKVISMFLISKFNIVAKQLRLFLNKQHSEEVKEVDAIEGYEKSEHKNFSKIFTKNIEKDGKHYVKILGFKNVRGKDELVDGYIKQYPHYYTTEDTIFLGKDAKITLALSKISKVYLCVDDEIELHAFRYYVEKMREAGKRLGELRKSIKNTVIPVKDSAPLPTFVESIQSHVNYII